ncbi:carboxypeptidase-like regulatory domain-containing protein [Sphingobacterium faecale]|uniref:Carboxypeptidase regulatory-like domain-containing protein n=1 Tax=Sphingobacterium faecale TaxID=2803775 RepID=A0ABS1R0P3_9SPHI|nr:carboxypeptidase-like regulatory domain-containing protein [Sphingobacterium faecale]MBL1407617.1 hypothetical protein [Sphingobacterium faecale]
MRTIFWICFMIAVCGACDQSNEGVETRASDMGYATGKVTDNKGRPISGARIILDNTVFYASYIHGTTDKDGAYRIKLQPGAWRTLAYVDRVYNGQKYSMELFPHVTDVYGDEGAVRDFIWKLEGDMPWEADAYYGGTVVLTTDYGFYEDEENMELTFTPIGPLIDGSAGRVLTLHYGEKKWIHRSELWDIPIGRYRLTAVLKKNGKSIPLRIEDWYKRNGLVREFQLDFIPNPSNGVNNSASIVIGY